MPHFGVNQRLQSFDYARERTFLVTFTTRHRQPIFSDAVVGSIAKDVILSYRDRGWYWLLAYCVMPDHVHLLLRLRDKGRTLSRLVATLKCQIVYRARHIGCNVQFQWGFHDWILRAEERPDEFAKYVIANPVRAKLVREAREYPFSGIVDLWY